MTECSVDIPDSQSARELVSASVGIRGVRTLFSHTLDTRLTSNLTMQAQQYSGMMPYQTPAYYPADNTHQSYYMMPTAQQNMALPLSVPVYPARKFRTNQPEILRCKRRADLNRLGYKSAHPVSVARRNERERNRVKHINSTFLTLRDHLPMNGKNKKMSKVDTLHTAIKYIKYLQQVLEEHDVIENARVECGGSGGVPSPALSPAASVASSSSTASPNYYSPSAGEASPGCVSQLSSTDGESSNLSPDEEELFDFASTWF